LGGLPDGVTALIDLSRAVPSRVDARQLNDEQGFLTTIGESAIATARSFGEGNLFLGESLQALGRFFRGTARFMRSDVTEFIQATGPQALPIVGIINVLLGMILGLMGAVQLQQFGAEIYVANLVALGQTREIAPMMTAIVMAGRTGAAYAAQLGTMQVNEEIDALKTFGFSPMDFLVLPRMLALAVMFPLLVLYADALGIFGGYLVGVGMLDLGTTEYIEQTRNAIDMGDIMLGVVKGSVFGVLVAVTGCMQGMHSGRSAAAVGEATTLAVVKGIIAIIAMTAVFSVLTNVLGV
jgi:phospholipid/cholesterol/gamma-HCH transport system permease protein